MSKNSRSAQARINGAKSKGPKTRLGKFISSTNSFKTGLHAAKSGVLKLEDSAAYDQQLAAYIRRFRPQDPIELNYVYELCRLDWQIHRTNAYLTAALNHQLDANESTYKATDIAVSDDLKGALAVDSANKTSVVIQTLTIQSRRLCSQRLTIFRALREIRKMLEVLVPGFDPADSEELNPNGTPQSEPEPVSAVQEAA